MRLPARASVALGLALVAAYAAVQTLALPEPVPTIWLAVAVGLTLLSPLGGLTIAAAIGPFTEALTDSGQITAMPYLLAALGVAVLVRVVITRPLPRPSWPVVLGLLLMIGTALGVVNSYLSYGDELGRQAAEMWVPSIGGAMTVLIAAAWVGWRESVAPFFIAIASSASAAILSVVNLETNGFLRQSTAIGWLLREETTGNRLTGIIPAPNPAAVIFLLGFAGALALAVLAFRRWWTRLLPLPIAAACLAAIFLTGSRSGMLGAAVATTLILIAWHWRVGLAAGVALIATIIALIPAGIIRDVPIAAEQTRIDAWVATLRLWSQHPIFGAGFRSFEWLHPDVGSAVVNAPHNEWLRFLAEEGIVLGLVGLAFALLTPIVLLRANNWIAATGAAVAAGAFVAANFNNPFIYTQVNVALFTMIGIGLGLAVRRRNGVGPERLTSSSAAPVQPAAQPARTS